MDTNTRTDNALWRAFLTYYRPHRALFWADTVCALGLAAIDLAFPQILRQLTGGLFSQRPDEIRGALLYLGLGLVAMYALRFFFRWFVTKWGHIMGARMESQMRQDLFEAYERFSFGFFDRHNTGELMSRVTGDLFDIAEAAHHGPEWAFICALEISGSFVMLALISWQLSLALALVTVAITVYVLRTNKRLQETFTDNRRKMADVNSQLEDSLAGMRVVKSFASEEAEARRFARANEAYLESKARNYHAMGLYNAIATSLTGALYTVIVVYGGLLVADGTLVAADLATYALYVSMFLSPIQTMIEFTEMYQKARAGFERFWEVLETVPDVAERPGAPDLVVSEGRVVYAGVRFAYDQQGTDDGQAAGAERNDGSAAEVTQDGGSAVGVALDSESTATGKEKPAEDSVAGFTQQDMLARTGEGTSGSAGHDPDGGHVLRGMDLELAPGKTLALVGPSGGGKSTTCALLPRFYDVDEGSITIDGQDVRDVSLASLRRAVGMVQQEVYLFGGTIGENIAYGREGATFAEVREAARQANIADFIESLPDGYDTVVGERGCRLSGGQRQRIAIARVFLKDPEILILDEATSALDNESERAVQESLALLARERTTLVIAHRLSTIRSADEIATIQDGRVVERGTHEELLARGGTYANYYHMQFG